MRVVHSILAMALSTLFVSHASGTGAHVAVSPARQTPPEASPGAPGGAPPARIMVLGTTHFDNPGQDANNVKSDNMLSAKRQAELQAVARALLTFQPTVIAVERQSSAADLRLASYTRFQPSALDTIVDESVQLGYRIAHLAKLSAVYGIDELAAKGEPDYFPMDRVQSEAERLGQTRVLEEANAPIAAWSQRFEAAQQTRTVAEMLIAVNDPRVPAANMTPYYTMLHVGDTEQQAGAELNAMWYLRNAKIFSKLLRVTRPGDRVLVVFGAGHGYWLRHFASTVPGFVSVDPRPYLLRSASRATVR